MWTVTPYDCHNGHMAVALAHAHYDRAHLAAVESEMRQRGAPTVAAIWYEPEGIYVALEGCHRLRAAANLGFTPTLLVIDDWQHDDLVSKYAPGSFSGNPEMTLGDVLDGLPRTTLLTFDSAE